MNQEVFRREGDAVVHQNFEVVLSDEHAISEDELIRNDFMKLHRRMEFRDHVDGVIPDDRVLDIATIRYKITERSAIGAKRGDYKDTLLGVKASAIRRTPMRTDPIDTHVDVGAYRSGTTFSRAGGGGLYVNHIKTLVTLVADPHPMFSLLPLCVLWEPDHEMDWQEIDKAEYDPETGIPARWHVQQDSHYSLKDGAL